MPAWTGTLHFRHRRLFRHRFDLWKPDYPIDDDSDPSDTTYALNLSAVPGIRDTKSAVDAPELVGLVEGEDMITVDTFRCPPGTELGSNWIIVDRSGGLNQNRGWTCKGEPVREEDADAVRTTGMVEAYATRLARLPAAIRTHYGL
jgi:hypothetical protein